MPENETTESRPIAAVDATRSMPVAEPWYPRRSWETVAGWVATGTLAAMAVGGVVAIAVLAGCAPEAAPARSTVSAEESMVPSSIVPADEAREAEAVAAAQSTSATLAERTADEITSAAVLACNVFDAGMPLDEWRQLAAGDGFAPADAAEILEYAVTTICPAHVGLASEVAK